jgi:vacuolar protein sorting-associated protein 26
VEHLGIKVELIGQIELLYDRGNPSEFTSLVRELEGPGELTENKSYPFDFGNIEKVFETYTGANVRLRYFLRARLTRQYLSNVQKTLDFAIQALGSEPEVINTDTNHRIAVTSLFIFIVYYNRSIPPLRWKSVLKIVYTSNSNTTKLNTTYKMLSCNYYSQIRHVRHRRLES